MAELRQPGKAAGINADFMFSITSEGWLNRSMGMMT
jgi:hypothetical protein